MNIKGEAPTQTNCNVHKKSHKGEKGFSFSSSVQHSSAIWRQEREQQSRWVKAESVEGKRKSDRGMGKSLDEKKEDI